MREFRKVHSMRWDRLFVCKSPLVWEWDCKLVGGGLGIARVSPCWLALLRSLVTGLSLWVLVPRALL